MATEWGPWCRKCGHPASYHRMTDCQHPSGAEVKVKCDCDGYAESGPTEADPPPSEPPASQQAHSDDSPGLVPETSDT